MLWLIRSLEVQFTFHLHLTQKETESQAGCDLPRVKQLIGSGQEKDHRCSASWAGACSSCTWEVMLQNPVSVHVCGQLFIVYCFMLASTPYGSFTAGLYIYLFILMFNVTCVIFTLFFLLWFLDYFSCLYSPLIVFLMVYNMFYLSIYLPFLRIITFVSISLIGYFLKGNLKFF